MAMVFLIAAVRQAAQQLTRLCCDAVDPDFLNLHAAIQITDGLLEIDTVSLFQQRHIVEVIDQGKVPGICSVNFIVGCHFHPFLKVRQNWDPLHRRHCARGNN